jgi:hypothetical protein
MFLRTTALVFVAALALAGCFSRPPEPVRNAEYHLKQGEAYFERGAFDQASNPGRRFAKAFTLLNSIRLLNSISLKPIF